MVGHLPDHEEPRHEAHRDECDSGIRRITECHDEK